MTNDVKAQLKQLDVEMKKAKTQTEKARSRNARTNSNANQLFALAPIEKYKSDTVQNSHI
jgi:hypothetical protein